MRKKQQLDMHSASVTITIHSMFLEGSKIYIQTTSDTGHLKTLKTEFVVRPEGSFTQTQRCAFLLQCLRQEESMLLPELFPLQCSFKFLRTSLLCPHYI